MERHVVIIGGGLAGLSAGCYAAASGFRTTLVEHHEALGGVCTSWTRGAYNIDGCIHWLTGGPFDRIYEELGILPAVERRVLEEWFVYRAPDGATLRFTRDLDLLGRELRAWAPEDAAEIDRLIAGARAVSDLGPPVDPRELMNLRGQLSQLWERRHQAGALFHFRMPCGAWTRERLRSPRLRRMFEVLFPPEAPAIFGCMVLGYLARGYLSRPVGGTTRFRDALIETYARVGGEARTHATVEELLIADGRVSGVRLADGTLLAADAVIATTSLPELALHLLGGRYASDEVRERLATWRLISPIVLASYGVDVSLRGLPSLWMLDGVEPFDVGGATNDHLYVRICNDEPAVAPVGHTVLQAMIGTTYAWWATRDARYEAAKDAAANLVLERLARLIPELRDHVQMIDVATPLTFWNKARSWRGAFEGWVPRRASAFTHVPKLLGDLRGLYLAGQWVEPGGGIPTVTLSGRQAAALLCHDEGRALRTPVTGLAAA